MTPTFRATPQAVSGALIAVALALSGCVFHRTTIVNVRADDHFDIRPIVRDVNVSATLEAPVCNP